MRTIIASKTSYKPWFSAVSGSSASFFRIADNAVLRSLATPGLAIYYIFEIFFMLQNKLLLYQLYVDYCINAILTSLPDEPLLFGDFRSYSRSYFRTENEIILFS